MQQFKIPTNIITYRGIDAAKKFVENMIDISKKINDIYQINTPMIALTEKEEKEFQIAKKMNYIKLGITVILLVNIDNVPNCFKRNF
ncbi:putative inhibitor of apoptosis [Aphis craccivora]|uniref:Putative inhibitor of apoptosis n=1 Tax=Aphis craccivora TaxID=307492 RepID=A0A6G0XMH1_APHCR|nr:putative inhibitor of apoptosis [Aphis craccivora]